MTEISRTSGGAAPRAVIAVTGASSNAGKTHLAENLIRRLSARGHAVAALKITRTHVGHCPREADACGACDSLDAPFRIITDAARIDVPGKDTGRYVAAGARQVIWLLVEPPHTQEGVREALGRVAGGEVLVAEGNAFLDAARADIAFMALSARHGMKPSAAAILDRIDRFVARPADMAALREELEALDVRAADLLDADAVDGWFERVVLRPLGLG